MSEAENPEPRIVSAVGTSSPLGRGARGKMIEEAMSQAVYAAEQEVKAIWEDTSLPEEVRRERVAAIMSHDSIRERKLAARERAKQDHADKANDA